MTVCVYGAGSIGCTLGGRLAAAGVPVTLVGRPRIAAEIADHGLLITDLDGGEWRAAAAHVPVSSEPGAPAGARLVLVTVKSAATAGAAAELAETLAPDVVVISFQNGLGNVDVLRAALPGRTVLAGMVPFNVVHRGDGRFHIATSGWLEVQADPALGPYREGFRRAGLELREQPDLRPVQWAKLLLNLNNAINALSGLPLRTELSDRRFRRCLALAMAEAIRLLRRSGQPVARLTPLPPSWLPRLIAAPDPVFSRLAGSMIRIDPSARSSMLDDLDLGRPTEVDDLNGEVVRLARHLGLDTPVNQRLVDLVRAAETDGRRTWSGADLQADLTATAYPRTS